MLESSSVAEWQLIGQLVEDLQQLPDVHAHLHEGETSNQGSTDHDAQIDLRVAGKDFVLLIEAKRAVYPRDAREVVWHFRELRHGDTNDHGGERLRLLIAESISPGAKELLREERVGYYDSGGSLYLPAPEAYLYIDKPPPKALEKSARSLFSGRRAQVLHALLMQHRDWFGVKDVADRAMVSPSTASQVMTELDRFDWVKSRGQGPTKERQLIEPAALLDTWAKQVAASRPPKLRRYFVPAAKAEMLPALFDEACELNDAMYAVTHEAAAQRYSPFLSSVSQVRARLWMGPNAQAALGSLDARIVSEGANLSILAVSSPGELLFRERVDGVTLASPVQVYLDLLQGEGRAKEMAEHLRREKIDF